MSPRQVLRVAVVDHQPLFLGEVRGDVVAQSNEDRGDLLRFATRVLDVDELVDQTDDRPMLVIDES